MKLNTFFVKKKNIEWREGFTINIKFNGSDFTDLHCKVVPKRFSSKFDGNNINL